VSDVLVDAQRLHAFVAAVREAVDMERADARTVAERLVAAGLRGHEAHGVARLEAFYGRPIQGGRIKPRVRTVVLRKTAPTPLGPGRARRRRRSTPAVSCAQCSC
jgi:LDH2 family malate/lactate/ureidoglycolate dehydrogenase